MSIRLDPAKIKEIYECELGNHRGSWVPQTKQGRNTDLRSSLISLIGTIKPICGFSCLLTSGIRPIYLLSIFIVFTILPYYEHLDSLRLSNREADNEWTPDTTRPDNRRTSDTSTGPKLVRFTRPNDFALDASHQSRIIIGQFPAAPILTSTQARSPGVLRQ